MTVEGRQRCRRDGVARKMLEDRGQVRIEQVMQTEGGSRESRCVVGPFMTSRGARLPQRFLLAMPNISREIQIM